MSAFVVDKAHIDALVAAGLGYKRYGEMSWYHDGDRHDLKLNTADAVGQMLWSENVTSVEYRYSPESRENIYGEAFGDQTPVTDLPGNYQLEIIAPGVEPIEVPQWSSEYRYPFETRVRKPVEILKAISCLEYQSCEHPGWDESEAKAFCDALREQMINALPGYDDAAWGIS